MDLTQFLEFFASPIGLAGFTIAISEFVDKYWDLDGHVAFIRAAFIAAILCFLGQILSLGYMADVNGAGPTAQAILEIILISAGAFNFPLLKEFLELIKLRPKPEG